LGCAFALSLRRERDARVRPQDWMTMAELKTRFTSASERARSPLVRQRMRVLKRLSDVHLPTLKKLVTTSVRHAAARR
jgi:hypothetical protein